MKNAIFLLLICMSYGMHAQSNAISVIGAAGAEAALSADGNYVLYYTVGEMAIAQNIGTDGSTVREGFWQPGVTVLTEVVEIEGIRGNVKVFPNPTTGTFTLDLEEGFPVELHCTLFNALGAVVENAIVEQRQLRAVMGQTNLESGAYLLRIATADGRTIHTFRILKI